MKRLFTIILLFCIISSIPIIAYADIDSTTDEHFIDYYTDPYFITFDTDTGLIITDSNNPHVIYPGTATGSTNSVVNALYNGTALTLRKATQCTARTPAEDGIRFGYYNTFTNLTEIRGYGVKIHFPSFVLPEGSTIYESVIPYFSINFNGEIQECYISYRIPVKSHHQLVRDDYVLVNESIYLSDPYERPINYLVGTTGGNFFNKEIADSINAQFNAGYGDTESRCIYDLTFELYVQLEGSGTISYTTVQPYDIDYIPLTMYEDNFNVTATVLGDGFIEWLSSFIDGFFTIKVFGDVTFGILFWAAIGLTLVLIFLKFFAGG